MKKVIMAFLLIGMLFLFSGCVHATITESGVHRESNIKAYIWQPNNEYKIVDVETYESGYTTITITDLSGTKYFTAIQNVLLIKEP